MIPTPPHRRPPGYRTEPGDMTPRQRAAAAFAIIDRHHGGNQSSACPLFAYAELAAAMNQIYGPLPDETELQRIGRLRRAEANEGPRG